MENFKKIQEVYNKLSEMREFNKIYELSEVADFRAKECMKLIREFLIDNDKKSKKSKNDFSIWECVATDEIRYVMNNLCHDDKDKVAVATDAHILCVSKEDYIDYGKTYEVEVKGTDGTTHKETRKYEVYDKYGEPCEARYPNWRAVIPSEDTCTPITFDEELIRQRIAMAKAEAKLKGYKNFEKCCAILPEPKDGYGVDFKYEPRMIAAKYLLLMLAYGLDGWTIKFSTEKREDGSKIHFPCLFIKRKENGSLLMVMPILQKSDYEYPEPYFFAEKGRNFID